MSEGSTIGSRPYQRQGVRHFVMLRGHNDYPTPLMADDEHIAIFDSEQEATEAAELNSFAKAYGYEVYEWV